MAEIELKIDSKHFIQEAQPVPEVDGSMIDYLRRTYSPVEIFFYAENGWRDRYSYERFSQQIDVLMSIENVRDEDVKARYLGDLVALKELRKAGTRLIDCWKLIDERHAVPKQFEAVVSGIGDLKDEVWFLESHKRNTDVLFQRMAALEENPVPVFSPATFESFLGMYNKYLNDIKHILSLESPNLEQHHTLRRRMRTMRHYFSLMNLVTGGALAKQLSDSIEPISVEMGKAQNRIYVMGINGGIDIHSDVTRIQPRHREIIEAFLKLHNNS